MCLGRIEDRLTAKFGERWYQICWWWGVAAVVVAVLVVGVSPRDSGVVPEPEPVVDGSEELWDEVRRLRTGVLLVEENQRVELRRLGVRVSELEKEVDRLVRYVEMLVSPQPGSTRFSGPVLPGNF